MNPFPYVHTMYDLDGELGRLWLGNFLSEVTFLSEELVESCGNTLADPNINAISKINFGILIFFKFS